MLIHMLRTAPYCAKLPKFTECWVDLGGIGMCWPLLARVGPLVVIICDGNAVRDCAGYISGQIGALCYIMLAYATEIYRMRCREMLCHGMLCVALR